MNIKKIAIELLSFLFLFTVIHNSYFILPAYAHVLKTDGSIGAVMHVDPEDDPIAGSQSGFFFEFKDKQNKFDPAKCDCVFSITENGKEIFSQQLFANNTNPTLDNASLFYTFPQRDVYQVKIVGNPQPPSAFQKFTLVYDVRVARQASPSPNASGTQLASTNFFTTHIPHFIAAGIVALFLVAAIFKQKSAKKRK